jgi:3-hydroxybutyryl-CoA dehydrogenase
MIISIIGSGTMATGIAQVVLQADDVEKVIVIARQIEKAEKAIYQCRSKLFRLFRKGKLTEEQCEFFQEKLKPSCSISDVANSSLVIEAISENIDKKAALFQGMNEYLKETTIVATNTSSLSITGLASYFPFPHNLVGLHFFNPAPVMELVEIIVGHETNLEIVDKLTFFTKSLGKVPVVVQEAPGFVVNRMLIPMINEAISILAEGVANAEDIDKAMKFGAHHPMGPLALADLIGNDVNLSIMETLYSETGDPKYRAHPLLRKMVRANHLGRKTKKGFFKY